MSERDAYLKKANAKLKEWDAEIDKLRARAESASADATLDYERRLRELKAARDAAGDKLRELRNTGAENWQSVRHQAEETWERMSRSLKDNLDRLK